MDEKSVRAIRSLALPNGEVAGSAMPRNAAAKLAEEPQSCPECGGTGWKDVVAGSERRVARCGCFLQTQAKHILAASEIPARYAGCEFKL